MHPMWTMMGMPAPPPPVSSLSPPVWLCDVWWRGKLSFMQTYLTRLETLKALAMKTAAAGAASCAADSNTLSHNHSNTTTSNNNNKDQPKPSSAAAAVDLPAHARYTAHAMWAPRSDMVSNDTRLLPFICI